MVGGGWWVGREKTERKMAKTKSFSFLLSVHSNMILKSFPCSRGSDYLAGMPVTTQLPHLLWEPVASSCPGSRWSLWPLPLPRCLSCEVAVFCGVIEQDPGMPPALAPT